jgi:hypothetical protein
MNSITIRFRMWVPVPVTRGSIMQAATTIPIGSDFFKLAVIVDIYPLLVNNPCGLNINTIINMRSAIACRY